MAKEKSFGDLLNDTLNEVMEEVMKNNANADGEDNGVIAIDLTSLLGAPKTEDKPQPEKKSKKSKKKSGKKSDEATEPVAEETPAEPTAEPTADDSERVQALRLAERMREAGVLAVELLPSVYDPADFVLEDVLGEWYSVAGSRKVKKVATRLALLPLLSSVAHPACVSPAVFDLLAEEVRTYLPVSAFLGIASASVIPE